MIPSRTIASLALLTCVGLSPAGLRAETLRINSNDGFPRSMPDKSGFEDRIVSEAFRRIGEDYELVLVPSERALASVDRGEIDGDYVRIAGLGQRYPNLVMVDEPIAAMEFGTFTRGREIVVSSWEDLRERPFGRILGWKIVEQRTDGFPRASAVRDADALFGLLKAGRVEAVVYDTLQGRLRAKKLNEPFVAGPVLESRDMYLYLNARHADLAARLAGALRDMRREGVIERTVDGALERAGLR